MSVKVKFKKLDDKATVPERAHTTDTGYDLKFTGIHKINGDVIYFRTGISLQPSYGYYFEVVPRSSISKLPLSMANSVGVIDQHYTGEIFVPVRVHHSQPGVEVKNKRFPGGLIEMLDGKPPSMQAVAELILAKKPSLFQLILRKKYNCEFLEEELQETDRGSGGFGSTDEKE